MFPAVVFVLALCFSSCNLGVQLVLGEVSKDVLPPPSSSSSSACQYPCQTRSPPPSLSGYSSYIAPPLPILSAGYPFYETPAPPSAAEKRKCPPAPVQCCNIPPPYPYANIPPPYPYGKYPPSYPYGNYPPPYPYVYVPSSAPSLSLPLWCLFPVVLLFFSVVLF